MQYLIASAEDVFERQHLGAVQCWLLVSALDFARFWFDETPTVHHTTPAPLPRGHA